MLKKKLIILTLCLITTTMLFGCGTEDKKEVEEKNEGKTMKIENKYDKMSYIVDKTYEKTNSNVLYSPLSLDMSLGMTTIGASGETKKQLDNYLGNDNYPEFAKQYITKFNELNKEESTYELIQPQLNEQENKNIVEIANSVWINDKYKIQDNYRKNVEEYFDAKVENISFTNPTEAVNTINNWCNEKTHEMIPKIITEDSIDSDSRAILVNSLYFKSGWVEPFTLVENDLDFKGLNGESQKMDKLISTEGIYYENKNATAFGKSYQNGIKFIGILPKDEGEFNISDLDIESLLDSKNTDYDVTVNMPKLNYESEHRELVDNLQDLGLKDAFNSSSKFDKIIKNDNLYISDIIQKCKIELDENGTKAAAVTAIMMKANSLAPQEEREIKEVKLDRPFVYLIYDEENDQVLFIGKVVTVE